MSEDIHRIGILVSTALDNVREVHLDTADGRLLVAREALVQAQIVLGHLQERLALWSVLSEEPPHLRRK